MALNRCRMVSTYSSHFSRAVPRSRASSNALSCALLSPFASAKELCIAAAPTWEQCFMSSPTCFMKASMLCLCGATSATTASREWRAHDQLVMSRELCARLGNLAVQLLVHHVGARHCERSGESECNREPHQDLDRPTSTCHAASRRWLFVSTAMDVPFAASCFQSSRCGRDGHATAAGVQPGSHILPPKITGSKPLSREGWFYRVTRLWARRHTSPAVFSPSATIDTAKPPPRAGVTRALTPFRTSGQYAISGMR